MEHTTVQRRRVYLACRAIFTGQNALVRKPKKIKELVEEHRRSLKPLIQDIGINKVTEILRTLLEGQIFQSELKAKLQFPELFCSTPGRNIQRAESENNAAKSVAEALEEISSLEDSNDMNRDENGQAHQALSTVRHGNENRSIHDDQVPSLYPLYIPYKAQHAVLTIVQRILEEACFNFTKVWLPAVLERNGWDCAEAVELTQWSKIFSHESANLPQHAIATGTESISNMLLSTYKIRHTVVHRLPITARGAIQLIEPAIRVTEVLQDSLRASQLQELQKEVDSRIDAMELSKNVLEDNVSRELDEIRLQRQMLDEKEKEIVANMFKEDDDNKSLIGTLIEESINRIFSEEGELQQTLEDQEPGSEGRSGVDLILRRST